jgi:hypothetical protein
VRNCRDLDAVPGLSERILPDLNFNSVIHIHFANGALDPAVAGGAPKERRNAEREGKRAASLGEGVAQTSPEDGVMLPRLLPMLAVPAAPMPK